MNVATAFVDSVGRFAAWWWMELKGLVPPAIHRWLDGSAHAAQLVLKGDGTVALRDGDGSGGGSETLYPTLDEAACTGGPLAQRPLQVVLAEGDCFAREVSIPRGARSRLRDVLAIDIEQSTPFRPEEIHWGYRLRPGSRGRWLTVRQFIAKRSRVEAVLEPLRRARTVIQSVGAEDTDGTFVSLYTLPERPLARTARLALRSTALALLAATVLLTGATLALLFHRQNVAMEALQADIERMREQAVAVRSRLDELRAASLVTDGLMRRKLEAAPLVAVLEEASRILPDTAWLTELQFERMSANISGEAQSAPELIQLLEASPLFSQVAFAAPVTRAAGSATESFTISLAIDGAGAHRSAALQARP